MKKNVNEIVLWLFITLPYLYVATIWKALPQKVPTHFNINGIANDWSDKSFLLFIPCGLGLFMYLLMIAIPSLDPKNKLSQMENKFNAIKNILVIFISILSIYLLYIIKEGSIKNPNLIITLLGALFVVLGNYIQTIRPNYFIGIRTPWTLENDIVWKKTHRFGGRLWMIGGLIISLISLSLNNSNMCTIVMIVLIVVLAFIPVIYSYKVFKQEQV